MSSDSNDPRVFFAAERTLLAWFRTGLAVVGLGFVVARFGVFLRLARGGDASAAPGSTAIGVGLVLLGALAIAGACVQHIRFSRTLGPFERPRCYWTGLPILWGFTLAFVGMVLAVYLVAGGASVPSRPSTPPAGRNVPVRSVRHSTVSDSSVCGPPLRSRSRRYQLHSSLIVA